MRLSGTKAIAIRQYRGFGNQLWDLAGDSPTLDLDFASKGDLVDGVTGKTLVEHTRASSGTYVGSDGLIKTATTNLLTYSEDFTNAIWPANSRATLLTATGVDDPSGGTTASTWKNGGNPNDELIHRVVIGTANIPYTYSVWLRRRSGTGDINMFVGDNIPINVTSQVTTEWKRISVTAIPSTTTVRAYISIPGSGDEIDVWGAQLEQSSTVGEYVKTTSTINSAPRFDHKVTRTTTNLALYSEEFEQWTESNSEVIINSSVAIAPDGTATADKIVENTASANHYVQSNSVAITGPVDITGSVYLKKGERRYVRLRLQTAAGPRAWFDLETGTVTAIDAATSDATITPVGNGWYRCTITKANVPTTPILVFQVFTQSIPGNQTVYTGDGTSGLYIWGAQLEQSSTVGPYVKTTGAPATQVDTESLGLLVEESRTNLILDSSGSTMTTVNVTAGTAAQLNPEGVSSCRRITAVSGLSGNGVRVIKGATTSANNTVVSAFVKKDTHRYVYIGFGGLSNSYTALFDIEPGLVGTRLLGQGGIGTYTNIDAGYQDYPNGWVRIWAVGTTIGSDGPTIGLNPDANSYNIINWTPAGTEAILLHGVQYEDNATFPTSYIPTEGSSVTRAPDITSIEGNNFGTFNLLQYSEEFDNARWSAVNSTVDPNTEVAPDGTLTADKQTHTGSGPRIARFSAATVTASSIFTFSFYAKAGTSSFAACSVYDGTTSGKRFWFDLSSGTPGNITNIGTGYPSATSQMQGVGNGWYRCIAVITNGTNTTVNIDGISVCLNTNGVLTPSVSGLYGYLWGAQLEESSTVTPYVKSDVTWQSRASNATYYDSTGTLKKSSYNLLTWSEDFLDSSYVKATTVGPITRTSNQAISPDGTLTADKIVYPAVSNSGDFSLVYKPAVNLTGTYTTSIYLKGENGGERIYLFYRIDGGFASQLCVLTTEWQRFELTFTGGTLSYWHIGYDLRTGTDQVAESGGTVYVWGAQLEKGPYAGDYVKTEGSAASSARNVAFLPDGNGNFVSAGELLLEDAGTNNAKDSEDFSTGQWTQVSDGLTVDTNQATAPDGTYTANLLTSNAGTADKGTQTFLQVVAIGEVHTVSCFFKAATSNFARLQWQGGGDTAAVAVDLRDGSVIYRTNEDSYKIDALPNSWYRISITNTATQAVGYALRIYICNANGSLTGATGSIYAWGAQAEANSYATSYIPTYGSTATRAADVSSSSSGFGNSWYQQDAGTARVEWHNTAKKRWSGFYNFFAVRNPSATEYIGYGVTNGNNGYQVYWSAKTGNNNQLDYGAYTPGFPDIPEGSWTHAIALTTNDAAFYEGGFQRKIDNSVIMPNPTEAIFQTTNTCLKRVTFWPARLSNDTLKTITE